MKAKNKETKKQEVIEMKTKILMVILALLLVMPAVANADVFSTPTQAGNGAEITLVEGITDVTLNDLALNHITVGCFYASGSIKLYDIGDALLGSYDFMGTEDPEGLVTVNINNVAVAGRTDVFMSAGFTFKSQFGGGMPPYDFTAGNLSLFGDGVKVSSGVVPELPAGALVPIGAVLLGSVLFLRRRAKVKK